MNRFKVTLRNIYKTSIIALTALVLCCFTADNKKHIGEWKGESMGQVGSLILDNANYAVIVVNNQKLGGDSFTFESGKKGVCKYEIDYSKNPIWLDIVMYEQGNAKEVGRIRGIARFLTADRMEYRINLEGNRFENFDPEDKLYTIILDRVKNKVL